MFTDINARLTHFNLFQNALAEEQNIVSSTFASTAPGNGFSATSYTIEDQDLLNEGGYPIQFSVSIADNYFNTFGVSLTSGRSFGIEDSSGSLFFMGQVERSHITF